MNNHSPFIYNINNYLSRFLVKIPISISPDNKTNTYTILVSSEPSPNKYSTKLKSKSPTSPQLIQPIILIAKNDLNNVFIIPPL